MSSRDLTTLLTLFTFVLAAIIHMVTIVHSGAWWNKNSAEWYDLDPAVLRDDLSRRDLSTRDARTAAGLINVLAWLCFLFPLTSAAAVLSRDYRHRESLHAWMVVLGFAAFFTECVSRLMAMGMENVVFWVSRDFNLEDWGASTTKDDQIGWRVVEILHTINNGIIMWVEAFEWLAMGGIMFLLFVSISTESEHPAVFSRRFGRLSLFISLVSVCTFAAHVFRIESHRVFVVWQFILLTVNVLILYPLWFVYLSKRLPEAVADLAAANIVGQ
jgi:hypothetical protein